MEELYIGDGLCHIHSNVAKYDCVVFETLANNDGLTLDDWRAWFSNPRYDRTQPMAIIHFTKFRYCK